MGNETDNRRINEDEAAKDFMKKLKKEGVFVCEHSLNTEVDYQREKDDRDTQAVRNMAQNNFFAHLFT